MYMRYSIIYFYQRIFNW